MDYIDNYLIVDSKSYQLKTTHRTPPYIQVNTTNFLDLTTNTNINGDKLIAKIDDSLYRPLQSTTISSDNRITVTQTTGYSGASTRGSTSGYSGRRSTTRTSYYTTTDYSQWYGDFTPGSTATQSTTTRTTLTTGTGYVSKTSSSGGGYMNVRQTHEMRIQPAIMGIRHGIVSRITYEIKTSVASKNVYVTGPTQYKGAATYTCSYNWTELNESAVFPKSLGNLDDGYDYIMSHLGAYAAGIRTSGAESSFYTQKTSGVLYSSDSVSEDMVRFGILQWISNDSTVSTWSSTKTTEFFTIEFAHWSMPVRTVTNSTNTSSQSPFISSFHATATGTKSSSSSSRRTTGTGSRSTSRSTTTYGTSTTTNTVFSSTTALTRTSRYSTSSSAPGNLSSTTALTRTTSSGSSSSQTTET